jgi:hypothetical protein
VVKLDLGDVQPKLRFFTIGKKINVKNLYLLIDQDVSTESVSIGDRASGGGTGSSDEDAEKLGRDLEYLLPLHHYASEGSSGVSFGISGLLS